MGLRDRAIARRLQAALAASKPAYEPAFNELPRIKSAPVISENGEAATSTKKKAASAGTLQGMFAKQSDKPTAAPKPESAEKKKNSGLASFFGKPTAAAAAASPSDAPAPAAVAAKEENPNKDLEDQLMDELGQSDDEKEQQKTGGRLKKAASTETPTKEATNEFQEPEQKKKTPPKKKETPAKQKSPKEKKDAAKAEEIKTEALLRTMEDDIAAELESQENETPGKVKRLRKGGEDAEEAAAAKKAATKKRKSKAALEEEGDAPKGDEEPEKKKKSAQRRFCIGAAETDLPF